MATVTKIFQRSLSHRVPLIRFRYGLEHGQSHESDTTDHEHSQPVETAPKPTKKGAALEFNQTPKKYRRRPLTQDEIDLVTIGGCA